MNNQEIEKKSQVVRVEYMASKPSSFYLGLSNRLIVPLLYTGFLTFINVTPWIIISAFAMIIVEIVIRYALKSTLRDEMLGLWNFFFGTKRKRIRN